MTNNIFVLKGELNGENRSGAFLFLLGIGYSFGRKILNIDVKLLIHCALISCPTVI